MTPAKRTRFSPAGPIQATRASEDISPFGFAIVSNPIMSNIF